MMYDQGLFHWKQEISSWFSARGIRVIHLVGKDKFQQVILSNSSNRLGKKDKRKNHMTKEDTIRLDEEYKDEVDPSKVVSAIKYFECADKRAEEFLAPVREKGGYYVQVMYEDLVVNTDMIMSRVQTFLGEDREICYAIGQDPRDEWILRLFP